MSLFLGNVAAVGGFGENSRCRVVPDRRRSAVGGAAMMTA
jgi:hypothetical protein